MNKLLSEIVEFTKKNDLVLSHFDPNFNGDSRKLTFCDDPKLASEINNSQNVVAVIVSPELSKFIDLKRVWISEDPRYLFFSVQNLSKDKYISARTEIGKNVTIASTALISKFGVKIHDNVTIGDGVIVKEGTSIGPNSIIGSYCVLGGQGFQFQRRVNLENEILKVKHTGSLHIGENVELKEFCSLHRGLFDWDCTIIGDNSKLDSHCHLGHGAKIGNNVLLCSHANLSGNNYIGNNSYIGPGANVPNRIRIHSKVKLSVGSTVTTDILDNEHFTGNFAIPHELFIKNLKSKLK